MANKTNIEPKLPLYYSETTEEIIINGVKKISEFTLITDEALDSVQFDVLLGGDNRRLSFDKLKEKLNFDSKTYDEMIAMQTNNQFVVNQNYLITDYRTTYIQPSSGIKMGGVGQENENPIEQLLVTALSTNKLSNECYSLSYPQDIIYYDLNKNTEGFTKGKIYKRIDTIQKNNIGTDWRNIKYRRYKLNVTNEWVSGGNYVVGDVVVHDGDIYYCFIEDNNSETLEFKWNLYPFSNGAYSGFDKTNKFYVGKVSSYIPIDKNDYQDSYLFESYNANNINCEIKMTLLNNIKLFGNYHNDISIGNMCYNININNYTERIKINEYCNNVNIGMYSYPVTIMNDCSYILIGDNAWFINIGSRCKGISIGLENRFDNINNYVSNIVLGKFNNEIYIGNNCSSIFIDTYASSIKINNDVDHLVFNNSINQFIQLIEVNPYFSSYNDSLITYPGIESFDDAIGCLKTVSLIHSYKTLLYIVYNDAYGDEIITKIQI